MPAKRVTMREIARMADVSRTTVSFVLNDVPGANISEETRSRILEVAKELNYIADQRAKSLVSGKAGTIALVLRQSSHQMVSDAFLAPVLQGLVEAVKDEGYHVLVEPLDPHDTSATYGNLVRGRKADGVILSGPRVDDEELLRIYQENLPVVMMGQLPGADIPCVDVDNVQGAYVAVRHLLDLGHRRIACITNAIPTYTASRDRLTGYQLALESAQIPYDDSLVRYGDFTDESGKLAMSDLLENTNPLPTAVFVASDVVALGALNAIQCAGLRVPEDMALVGFDDIPLAQYMSPALTTVQLPAYGLGWGSGRMLLRRIANNEEILEPCVLLKTELVVRSSCGGA